MKLKNALRAAAAALLTVAATASQAAEIRIDFDAFPSFSNFAGGSEDGFTLTATSASLIGLASLVPDFSRENYIATDNSGNWILTLVETDASAFEFLGLAGTTAGVGTEFSAGITVRGFQGMTLVGTEIYTVTAPALGSPASVFNASALSGLALTKVEIEGQYVSGRGISAFADNIRLNPDVAAVPEPGTLALLGLGLAGLAGTRRRKQ